MESLPLIERLLLEWERRRNSGENVTPEELCQDCPEQLDEVRSRIQALESMDFLLQTGVCADSSTDSRVSSSEPYSPEMSYTILRSHAQGGLGEVLLARDDRLGRRVALKRLKSGTTHDPLRRKRFLREAEITAQLEHPGIVPVHCVGEDEAYGPYYSMRFVEGETLEKAIAKLHQPNISAVESNKLLRQLLGRFVAVCNTIAYAHKQGFIHRDIKPLNIMVGEYGETLVVDWGLAKRIEDSATEDCETIDDSLPASEQKSETHRDPLTQVGSAIGTPAFMSPEQASGDLQQMGVASDIYSLGASLYLILTGKPPSGLRNAQAYMARIQRGEFPPPRDINPNVSPSINAICLKAMAFRPMDRYASALVLASDVENWLADEAVSVWRDSLATRTRRWLRQHQKLAVACTVLTIAVIIGAITISIITSITNEKLRIANQNEQDSRQLADQQSELAIRSLQTVTFDIQRSLKNVPAAQNVRVKLLETALAGLSEVSSSLSRRKKIDNSLLTAHQDLGDVFFEVGNIGNQKGIESARSEYLRAKQTAQALIDASPQEIEPQRQLGRCLLQLGKLELASGDTQKAWQYQTDAMKLLEKLSKMDMEDASVRRSLGSVITFAGELAAKQGQREKSGQCYIESLDIFRDLFNKYPNDSLLERSYFLALRNVGDYQLAIGETQAAQQLYQQSLSLIQNRVKMLPYDNEALRDLSSSLYQLGKLNLTQGQKEKALEYFKSALESDESQLALDSANSLAQRDVVQSSNEVASTLKSLNMNSKAEPYLSRSIDLSQRLLAADPGDKRIIRDLAFAHAGLGDIFSASDTELAILEYEKCLATMRQLKLVDPTNPRTQSDVAYGLSKLGDGLLALERVDEAMQHYSQALDLQRQRAIANPTDVFVQRNFVAFLQRLASTCRKNDRLDQAGSHYNEALNVIEGLSERVPSDIRVQILLVTILDAVGLFEGSQKRFTEAQQHLNRALEVSKKLQQEGMLTGEDAGWIEFLEQHILETKELETKEQAEPIR